MGSRLVLPGQDGRGMLASHLDARQSLSWRRAVAASNPYVPPGATTTWDSANKDATLVLSNGDLTAAAGAPDGWQGVMSVLGKDTGLWYWEVTMTSIGGGCLVGIGTSTASTAYLGSDANGWAYFSINGKTINNGSQVVYGSTYTSGDIIGVYYDADAGTVGFLKNNVDQGTAFTGLSGTLYAGMSVFTNGNNATANFGGTALTYAPPSGYNAGLYA